jgi:hypothetical protein
MTVLVSCFERWREHIIEEKQMIDKFTLQGRDFVHTDLLHDDMTSQKTGYDDLLHDDVRRSYDDLLHDDANSQRVSCRGGSFYDR